TATYWLAHDVLAFAGLALPSPGRKGAGDYTVSTLSPAQLQAESGRDRLPDALFLVAPPPAALARGLVQRDEYRLVPLRFRDAFALEAIVRPDGVRTGVDQRAHDSTRHPFVLREHVVDTVIPAFTYQADPGVPAEPLHTFGLTALLVAHRDV